MKTHHSLQELGWNNYFQQQMSLDEYERCIPARILGQERSELHLAKEYAGFSLPVTPAMSLLTVGDWILLDEKNQFHRSLERFSYFARKGAGAKTTHQSIAANIDTVFIVSSMNLDFNLNRLERYLALTNEASVEAVIVLTKKDCCDNPNEFISNAGSIGNVFNVIGVNALDPDSVNQLVPWCGIGKTIAFLGSSGVGKSTLINTLMGDNLQRTQAIRADDEKGRHTTTGRTIFMLSSGGLLLDTPGMRELALFDCEHGIDETFPEITKLAQRCKFSDCHHLNEPDCAVLDAIRSGEIDGRRLGSFQKLLREQAFNTATLAEKREKDRKFGKHVKSVMKSKLNKR